MGDAQTWAYVLGAPAWLAFLVYLVRTVRDWPNIMAQWNARQRDKVDEKAQDWSRLRGEIERLDGRCERLEIAEEACRGELASAKGRLAELEGFMMGQGKARNDAAAIVATERLADRKAREGG